MNDAVRFFIVLICPQIIERFGWGLWSPCDRTWVDVFKCLMLMDFYCDLCETPPGCTMGSQAQKRTRGCQPERYGQYTAEGYRADSIEGAHAPNGHASYHYADEQNPEELAKTPHD